MRSRGAGAERKKAPPEGGEFTLDVGLEVHAELKTETKIFCGCATRFGAPPNSQVCPVCLGLPGVLPVVNRKVVDHALRVALACECQISQPCVFERKNYYYPDLPKNYQISQKRAPLGREGHLDFPLAGGWRRVRLLDIHMEEDTGKLLHPEETSRFSLVDFNRSGVPLLEIISAPDLHSLAEVEAYMGAVRDLLLYLEVSDCRMEEGQLRFEANISLRPAGREELGTRVEIKNLNSFRSVLDCLAYEVRRQRELLSRGEPVLQETRLWDEARGVSEAMRSKEEAHDYRYFPEPDLVPLEIGDDRIAEVRSALPELREKRRRRFVEQMALSEYDAEVLTADRALADFFESCTLLGGEAKAAANWLTGEFLRLLRERELAISESKLTPRHLARLLKLIDEGAVSTSAGKQVFQQMFDTGEDPEAVIEKLGLVQVSDESQLARLCEEILAEHQDAVESYRKGNEKSLGFLVGQAMRKSRGRANPQLLNQMLKERLEEKR